MNARLAAMLLVVGAAIWAARGYGAGLPRAEPSEVGLDAERLARIAPLARRAFESGDFAGCVIEIGRHGRVALLEAIGDRQTEPTRDAMRTDTVFDLASLTKPIATATSVMVLLERGELRLSDPARQRLPELVGEGTEAITIEQLLTHHAGYVPDNPLDDYRHGPEEAWRRLFALKPVSPPGTKFVYSDVHFELLGKLVERVSGTPLDEFARREVFAPLGMSETGYLPGPTLRARAAATEQRDGHWLVGEVHDPRAALLGGVAGHAGLFSTAADLARYAQMMLRRGELDGNRVLGPRTVEEMTRPRDVSGALRAAGWDVRSPYSKNRGDLMTDRAFGHGGFTGTAIWIDPGLDLFVVFLSTRLHPDGVGDVNDLVGRIGSIAAAAVVAP